MRAPHDWLWGWDDTPGIVSVWAEYDGRVTVWRRDPESDALVTDVLRFRPWVLVRHRADVEGAIDVGNDVANETGGASQGLTCRELAGAGELRFLVSADETRTLESAILPRASQRLGQRLTRLAMLGADELLQLAPEEQYLVASGRTYFGGLTYDRLRRLQLDLETTGLDPEHDRVFLIALRDPMGQVALLEATPCDDAGERALLRALGERLRILDPDVIENHNLHGFDVPFLIRRAERLRVPLQLGRLPGQRRRGAQRGARLGGSGSDGEPRNVRFTVPGRELLDSLDAVRRYDFATRELESHGLKAVARHFGVAAPDRELIGGARVWETYRADPERVRRYAAADVDEAAAVARILGGAAFALARLAPRRYERLADAGAATGVIDPLLVRAYLRAGEALPAHRPGDGTNHQGAGLHLFAAGVARRIVKADVASLYPSLMRQYRIGPSRDRLGAFLTLVDQLVEQRLAAKQRAAGGAAPLDEALSAAMKIVINSAYGYLGAGGLTRFADMQAANEVTRRGRELLAQMCQALEARGVTLLEADTDGIYFAVPESCDEANERRIVREVAALLPPLVKLELEGRYAAMLSHEPKNYVLQRYDGTLVPRGVAFRSSRIERFALDFLQRAIERLFADDLVGVRAAYVDTVMAVRRRAIDTYALTTRVRLTKSPAEYAASRDDRREVAYDAAFEQLPAEWTPGDTIRIYRTIGGRANVWLRDEQVDGLSPDRRDYDIDYYVRLLQTTYATRFARALTPEDYAAIFAPPEQLSLFAPPLARSRPILTKLPAPAW